MKVTRRIRLELHNARNRVEVERAVDVGKEIAGFVRAGFVFDLGLDAPRVNDEQDKSVLTGVEAFSGRDNLRGSRAMDESLGGQAGGGIRAACSLH